ncbi:MAG: ABC transporter ATP-binding protein [Candidatus Krumholzibacteriota bacterium]|nr:ABC transporter ATP-binding protein [Candidatus Krumholzibacteriota bacterium]
MLVIDGLEKRFGRVEALRGIDLQIETPGVYGFLGPNGAGKTTAFKIVCGLLRPTAGRVLVDGIDVAKQAAAAVARIGVLFDAPAFYPWLTGRENLEVACRWLGRGDGLLVDRLLDLTGLGESKRRRVSGYSWGMKRRLGLAAALLGDPPILLLDEPTNGLDPAGIADIRRLLPRLAREEGRAVLLSSHRMDEVEKTCDRVAIIDRGRILADGPVAELAAGGEGLEDLFFRITGAGGGDE